MNIYKQRSKKESYIITYYSHILQSVPAWVRDHVGSDLAAKWGVGRVNKQKAQIMIRSIKEAQTVKIRSGFDPWVGKVPWRRKWQPTPIFLPREFHGQRSLEA